MRGAAQKRFGFNDTAWGNTAIDKPTFLNKLQGTGATVWRIPVHWTFYEGQQGQRDDVGFWNYHQNLYTQALARGVKPIFVLVGTPAWARSPAAAADCNGVVNCISEPDVSNPAVLASWEHFAGQVATRYPQLAAIEVWNEPNIRAFWHAPQNPAAYMTLLERAATAIRATGTTAPILSGGLNNWDFANPQNPDPYYTGYDEFLDAIYVADPGGSTFDGISYHAYPCPGDPTPTLRIAAVTDAVRAVRNARGDSGTPLWLTEVGGSTGTGGAAANCGGIFTEAQQTSALGTILDWAKAQPADLHAVTLHSLFNAGSRALLFQPGPAEGEFGVVSWSTTFGFQTQDKPAYARVTCEFKNTC